LITFIDHRHWKSRTSNSKCRIVHPAFFLRHLAFPFSGRAGRNKRSITYLKNLHFAGADSLIAKKVLDDIRSKPPTKRLSWGSRQCRVNRELGHRGGSLELLQPPPPRSKQTRVVLGRFE
jgi:hypothetical protein